VATAFAWAVALLVAALVVPVYTDESSTSTLSAAGKVTSSTIKTHVTLVGENGQGALIALAVPAILSALVGLALHRKRTRGGVNGQIAWALVAALAVFAVLGMFTIGLFVLPVVGMLACATAITPAAPA